DCDGEGDSVESEEAGAGRRGYAPADEHARILLAGPERLRPRGEGQDAHYPDADPARRARLPGADEGVRPVEGRCGIAEGRCDEELPAAESPVHRGRGEEHAGRI